MWRGLAIQAARKLECQHLVRGSGATLPALLAPPWRPSHASIRGLIAQQHQQQRAGRAWLPRGGAAAAAAGPPPFARGTASVATAASKRDVAAYTAVQENIEEKELHVEASESYLAYAMSVIVGRALPDVRDGLKPVHRRILYAMHDLGISHARPYKKCARVVGEVLGKYHPHGDTAVYDALVRMAQGFSMQLPLVAGHGNFGSLDDDPPAAMRYTECRLAAASEDMLLADLESNTVDFAPTFDASQEEPLVLPARVPHLLVNGTQGIAVGIATKIPPHNLGEVVAALEALVGDPGITSRQLMQHVPAPDFPTGGEVIVTPDTAAAYETGNGNVLVRAAASIEYEGVGAKRKKRPPTAAAAAADAAAEAGAEAAGVPPGGKALIVFTEMPYQVCKSDLVQRIAEMVDAKQLDGISDVRDESDRTGVRLVVEVRRGFSPQLVLNQLYKSTRLQLRFSTNMVALVNGVPKTLTLKECLSHFLEFRESVVQRRAAHALARATTRLHLVEGLLAALAQLDDVVQAIRSAPDGPAAKASLISHFALSEAQAEGVLALTLRRLTGLEAAKLRDEAAQLAATIADLQGLLADRSRVLAVVLDEARAAAAKHGTPRRSRIVVAAPSAGAGVAEREEDVVPNTPSLITLSTRGYIKRMPASTWEVQRRGGQGKASGKLRDQDALEELLSCRAHDTLLLLSTSGRAYAVKAHRVPEASRAAMGSPIANVLGLPDAEHFPALLAVSSFEDADGASLVMATSSGGIKRTALSKFARMQRAGLAAIKLGEGERLAGGALALPGSHAILVSSDGQLAHFCVGIARQAGRAAGSVKGIKLSPGATLVGMTVLPPDLAQRIKAAQETAAAAAAAAHKAAPAAAGAADGADGSSRGSGRVPGGSRASAGPWLLLVTAGGVGKRVSLQDITVKSTRGLKGVIGINLLKGDKVAATHVVCSDDDDVVLATRAGVVMRCAASAVPAYARATRGLQLMSLQPGDEVQTLAVLPAEFKTALA